MNSKKFIPFSAIRFCFLSYPDIQETKIGKGGYWNEIWNRFGRRRHQGCRPCWSSAGFGGTWFMPLLYRRDQRWRDCSRLIRRRLLSETNGGNRAGSFQALAPPDGPQLFRSFESRLLPALPGLYRRTFRFDQGKPAGTVFSSAGRGKEDV